LSRLVYVSNEDCHFCAHGRAVLDELGVERREISSESDDAAKLAARGIPLSFLPVLIDGDHLIAYGRFSAKQLRKKLAL